MKNGSNLHLPKAPIIQAILEILVEPVPGKTINSLHDIHSSIKENYPREVKQFQSRLSFNPAIETTVSAETKHEGFLFSSENNLKSFIASLSQFAYIQSSQYTNWEDFISEAKTLWNTYRNTIKTSRIRRLSVRYINQINVEMPVTDIADYFLTYPFLSPKLPQVLEHFFLRYTIPYVDKNITANIAQSIGMIENNHVPFLFDIDVLHTEPIEYNEESMWQKFDELRDLKNEIFFSSLTDKTIQTLK